MSKEEAKNYKTIVISDLHLGSKWSKAKEATAFLKKNSCETLILCGDIIDGWALMRKKNKWKRRHTNFFKA
ncbi:MAG: UDP-2,3-diacylglucosamine diphosphatase, partial [Lentimicrobiaceae bacterium]|nr:UDP-2,3-diacylglucosamine diphosphatase [Lentimicrobiaceae bacterium]